MSAQTLDGPDVPVGQRPEDEMLAPGGLISFGLQHILSMFGGIISVPIIIGSAAGLDNAGKAFLLSCALFVSGIATILQSYGVPYLGSQLPLVQGISFASVSTLLTIIGSRGQEGLRAAFGACLVAGVISFAIVPLFAQIIRFFPPVVTGSVITVIGISLMPVAGKWITGQPTINVMRDGKPVPAPNPTFADRNSVILALITLLIVLVLYKVAKLARLAILLGLVLGTIVAFMLKAAGMAFPNGVIKSLDLSQSSPVAFPTPFNFGAPLFEVAAIFSMLIVMIVVMVETTADIIAVGEVVGTEVPTHRVADGLRADMLSSTVAPIFNTFPATAFAQNVGLVALTGVKSRFVVTVGGIILAVLGLSPWLAAAINIIPLPVLGGAGLALFGSVAASGIRTLSKVKYDGNNNLVIVAVSIAFGILPSLLPPIPGYIPNGFWGQFPHGLGLVLESGISSAAIVAFLLNLFFNMTGRGSDSDVHELRAHAPARAVDEERVAALPDTPRGARPGTDGSGESLH